MTKLKNAALIVAVCALLAIMASGCANCDYSYVQEKYSQDGKVVIERTTIKNATFSQGWSNGEGKTVDVHPQVDLLNM